MPPQVDVKKPLHQRGDSNTSSSTLTQERASESDAIQIPQILLAKDGGAIKGIDEKFQVNPSKGTALFSIPLPLSPNRNGFTTSLSVGYTTAPVLRAVSLVLGGQGIRVVNLILIGSPK